MNGPKIFEKNYVSTVGVEDIPSRFIYAFEQKRLEKHFSGPEIEQLRSIAAKHLGSLPIDLEAQKRIFLDGLAQIGVDPKRAEEIWNSDFLERLFQDLDDRFGPQFMRNPTSLNRDQRLLLDRLEELCDSPLKGHYRFPKWARSALKAAEDEAGALDLDDVERGDAIIALARAKLERKVRAVARNS